MSSKPRKMAIKFDNNRQQNRMQLALMYDKLPRSKNVRQQKPVKIATMKTSPVAAAPPFGWHFAPHPFIRFLHVSLAQNECVCICGAATAVSVGLLINLLWHILLWHFPLLSLSFPFAVSPDSIFLCLILGSNLREQSDQYVWVLILCNIFCHAFLSGVIYVEKNVDWFMKISKTWQISLPALTG